MVRLPPFQTLFDAHGHDIHRFLVASVGTVDADDCYQETWLAALRAYPGLRDDRNLRGWVFTIAHRKAMDQLRARRRTPLAVADIAADPSASTTDGPGLDDGDLWAAVAALPDKQRTAVGLRFIADLSYAELAAAMQTSEPAARRNVHEALRKLRQQGVTR